MSKKVVHNVGSGATQFWDRASGRRLNVEVGINHISEADFEFFKVADKISGNPNLKLVEDMGEVLAPPASEPVIVENDPVVPSSDPVEPVADENKSKRSKK